MKFKKYIPLLIATPFVLASCAGYIDISSKISCYFTGTSIVHYNVVPPQGFITAPTDNAATIINYSASLSSVGAADGTTCDVITYGLNGLDGITTPVTFANGTASISGTTFASGLDGSVGDFLEIENCNTVNAVSSSADISFTVGVDTYKGTHSAGTITG
jgi:hypothetical protein